MFQLPLLYPPNPLKGYQPLTNKPGVTDPVLSDARKRVCASMSSEKTSKFANNPNYSIVFF
jgi:hypothetical protein